MPTRILLIRHAETAAPGQLHGSESDVGLGLRGWRQAAHLAGHLAILRPDALFCSGMRRAIETCQPISEACGLPIRVVEELHERRMPSLSGRGKDTDAMTAYHEVVARWEAGDLDSAPEGDESYSAMRDRAVPAFLQATAGQEGRTLVFILHGLLIRVLLTTLVEGLAPADFTRVGIDNCAINDLVREGDRWRAVALGVRPGELP